MKLNLEFNSVAELEEFIEGYNSGKSCETKPAETKAAKTETAKPAEAKTVKTETAKPAETKTVKTETAKPAETKAAKPAEAKPAEAKVEINIPQHITPLIQEIIEYDRMGVKDTLDKFGAENLRKLKKEDFQAFYDELLKLRK